MLRDLDTESKLNRDLEFIQGPMSYGEKRAQKFLAREFAGAGSRVGPEG